MTVPSPDDAVSQLPRASVLDDASASPSIDPYYKWLGIPPAEQPPNHYRLLGINLFESDSDVISSAADQRMVHVRAFQAGEHSALAQKILNEISAARVCLLDPQKKLRYNQQLRERMQLKPKPPRSIVPRQVTEEAQRVAKPVSPSKAEPQVTVETIACPHCSQPIASNPVLAGQVVICPACRGGFQMPAPAGAPPPLPVAHAKASEIIAPLTTAESVPQRYPEEQYPQQQYPQQRYPQELYPQQEYGPHPQQPVPQQAQQIIIQNITNVERDDTPRVHLDRYALRRRGPTKSPLVAFLLAFFFGPLGMLYSTVGGGLALLLVNLVFIVPTAGLILLITWPLGCIWAAVAAGQNA